MVFLNNLDRFVEELVRADAHACVDYCHRLMIRHENVLRYACTMYQFTQALTDPTDGPELYVCQLAEALAFIRRNDLENLYRNYSEPELVASYQSSRILYHLKSASK